MNKEVEADITKYIAGTIAPENLRTDKGVIKFNVPALTSKYITYLNDVVETYEADIDVKRSGSNLAITIDSKMDNKVFLPHVEIGGPPVVNVEVMQGVESATRNPVINVPQTVSFSLGSIAIAKEVNYRGVTLKVGSVHPIVPSPKEHEANPAYDDRAWIETGKGKIALYPNQYERVAASA
jgi:hypothetical protein